MVILYILLALMLALIAVITFNTVKASKKARKLTEFKPFYNDDEIKYFIKTETEKAINEYIKKIKGIQEQINNIHIKEKEIKREKIKFN